MEPNKVGRKGGRAKKTQIGNMWGLMGKTVGCVRLGSWDLHDTSIPAFSHWGARFNCSGASLILWKKLQCLIIASLS